MLDDLISYRLAPERYLTVTNAANHERDLAWFREHGADLDAEVSDRLADYAMLAVQDHGRGDRCRLVRRRVAAADAHRRPAGAGGGERRRGARLRHRLHRRGRGQDPGRARPRRLALGRAVAAGAVPAGLAARDTLRLEACFCLYGSDLSTERNPIEAGLGWACAERTGFIGSEAVAAARAAGTDERLAPFALTERGIPRQGNPVLAVGEPPAVGSPSGDRACRDRRAAAARGAGRAPAAG